MSDEFDISLPEPFSENWREALRNNTENNETPRRTSYQAPNGSAISFVLVKTNIGGGQSNDVSEYPSFGGWSSQALNYLPQKIKITGRLTGDSYITTRNSLYEAFNTPTSDDDPAYIVLPFWGRFAVNMDVWDIDEKTSEQGGCEISLSVDRVGQSTEDRQETNVTGKLEDATEELQEAAISVFEEELDEDNLSVDALQDGFTKIKSGLLTIIGRLQLAQSKLNSITNEAVNLTSLIEQGITAPKDFADALFSCVNAITSAVASDVSAVEDFFSSDDEETTENDANNAQNAVLQFVAAKSYTMSDLTPSTNKELKTKTAMVALYRQAAFVGAATLLPEVDTISATKMQSLYSLLEELEDSLDLDDPYIYDAVVNTRLAVVEELRSLDLSNEQTIRLQSGLPLLTLSQLLGCDYDTLEDLNPEIEDHLIVTGEVTYV